MKSIYKYIIVSFWYLLITTTSVTFAQSKDINKLDWLSLGAGEGIQNHASSFISYTFINENVYQLKLNTDFQLAIFGNTSDYLYTGSFSYGFANISKWFFGSVFIGPSIAYKNYEESKEEFGIGINLNAQYYFACSDVLGFGIDLYTNFNTIKMIHGIRFSLFFKSLK